MTNKRTIVFDLVFITEYNPKCFGHLCGHFQGGITKNAITITKLSQTSHNNVSCLYL